MCVNTVVGFKIAALAFPSHHEHHQGGLCGTVAGYPVMGSLLFGGCWRRVLGARPAPVFTTTAGAAVLAIRRQSSPCLRPLWVDHPGWFTSAIYTLKLKMKAFA